MKEIKLKNNGGHQSIQEPSGRKIKRSHLEKGMVCLHKNRIFFRKIVAIENDNVFWKDNFGFGSCSTTHFIRTCPTEATSAEVDFLTLKYLKRL